MKKNFSKLLLIILFIALIPKINVYATEAGCDCRNCPCDSAEALKEKERILWGEHIFWTRNYLDSKLAALEDKDKVLDRLMKNQEDIGNSIIEYYDEEVGENLTKLLKEHIAIADKVVDAARSGNQQELKKYDEQWHHNADEIVNFLSSINPNYDKKTLNDLFYKHLALLTDQVVARMNKSYDEEILAFDEGEEHVFYLADAITSGIISKFPDKFK